MDSASPLGGDPPGDPPEPSAEWQVVFDDGHQQRYLPDRAAVLRYVLGVAGQAASPRFEVYESGPVRLADGSGGAGSSGWSRSSTSAARARPAGYARN